MIEALYDTIAGIYDPWSASVTEDVEYYVAEGVRSGGPVVELAVGTGRIAVPIATAGVSVIGVDQSEGMLERARAYAEREGVLERVDLRRGDLREPPVKGPVPLVIVPFRSLLHLVDEAEKLRALRAAARLLGPDGKLVFDVFAPSDEDIEETDGRWLEREPGIFERADWDREARMLTLSVRGGEVAASFTLHWLSAAEWRRLIAQAGLEVERVHGWFDGRPFAGEEDMIWHCRLARPLDGTRAAT
ncbi:MAG: class I SAM-dependent methyltransferase [Gaiella sp.]